MTVLAQASAVRRRAILDQGGFVALCGVAGALQFSIAAAQVLLTVSLLCWAALLLVEREVIELRKQNYTNAEIADKTGWNIRRVQRFLNKLQDSMHGSGG